MLTEIKDQALAEAERFYGLLLICTYLLPPIVSLTCFSFKIQFVDNAFIFKMLEHTHFDFDLDFIMRALTTSLNSQVEV